MWHVASPRLSGAVFPKDPAARYQRAGEVRAALEAVQGRASHGMTTRAKWGAAMAVGVTMLALLIVALRPGWMPDSIVGRASPPAAAPDAVPAIRGLAVLPLRNLGDDPRQYFADGLTAALVTELARVERLTVISQTSVMRYRDVGNRSLPQIGQELGVDALIEEDARSFGTAIAYASASI